jgi:phosphoglycolate phosphatase-like HAD superfamily hydrolase
VPASDAPPLVVLDFDGTLVDEGNDEVRPEIAAAVRGLADRWPVAVVTSRASERAVARARRALLRSGLGGIPLLHRDRTRHDNGREGLVASKRDLIEAVRRRLGARPAVGVGDRETDAIAYAMCGMTALDVSADLVAAWRGLPERVARAIGT